MARHNWRRGCYRAIHSQAASTASGPLSRCGSVTLGIKEPFRLLFNTHPVFFQAFCHLGNTSLAQRKSQVLGNFLVAKLAHELKGFYRYTVTAIEKFYRNTLAKTVFLPQLQRYNYSSKLVNLSHKPSKTKSAPPKERTEKMLPSHCCYTNAWPLKV